MALRPIVCSCGAVYKDVDVAPGESFSCGSCGRTLVVPAATEAPPVVQPTRKAPPSPATPTVTPVRHGPGHGSEEPPAAKAPPVVKPKARPPSPASSPAPARRVTGKPVAKKPGPIKPQRKKPAAPPPSVAAATPPAVPPPDAIDDPRPRAQRTTVRRPQPRKAPRRKAPVVQTAEAEPRRKKKGISPIAAWSFLGGALVLLIVVIIMVSGTSAEDKEAAYVAGYVGARENYERSKLGLPTRSNDTLWNDWSSEFAGDASRTDFRNGVADGRRSKEPQVGAESIEDALYDPERLISLVDASLATQSSSAEHHWSTADRVAAMMERWKKEQAPDRAVDRVLARSREIVGRVLELDPKHEKARERRGDVTYDDGLASYANASWLDEAGRARATKHHTRLRKLADGAGGFISKRDADFVAELQREFAALQKKNLGGGGTSSEGPVTDANHPFFKEAQALEKKVAEDVKAAMDRAVSIKDDLGKQVTDPRIKQALFASIGNPKDRTFTSFIRHPFVLLVENDPAWIMSDQADKMAGRLRGLARQFLDRYGKRFDLKEVERPLPVIFLRGRKAYIQYSFGATGRVNPAALAHFEPGNGRLVVNDSTTYTTLLHEGTHQLTHHFAQNRAEHNAQSFWFEEGHAEWWGGAYETRVSGEENSFRYEVGLMQQGRITGFQAMTATGQISPFSLKELISMTYASRNGFMQSGEQIKIGLVYSQGWMLIHFLTTFDVDAEGVIKIGTKERPVRGKYADGWERYLEFELKGKDGKPFSGRSAFIEAFELDDASLAQMGKEFDAYQKFLVRKVAARQIKKKRLIPWHKYVNRRGEKSGLKEDDMLFPDDK